MMPSGVQHRKQAKCDKCSGMGYAKRAANQAPELMAVKIKSAVEDPVDEEPVYESIEVLEARAAAAAAADAAYAAELAAEAEAAAAAAAEAAAVTAAADEVAVTECPTCKNLDVIKEVRNVCVAVPVGAETGLIFTFEGLGEQVPHGTAGDLIVRLIVDPYVDARITRHGEHIKAKLTASFIETIVGKDYELHLPSGEDMRFNTSIFEEIINPARLYIIKEKGLCAGGGSGTRGDLLVHFDVDYSACKLPVSQRQSHEKDLQELKAIFERICESA